MKSKRATSLLDAAYDQLAFAELEGDRFLSASKKSSDFKQQTWLDKGDWLALASEVEAEKIFFLENNPVVVFAHKSTDDWQILQRFYNRIWSMARPRFLFLETPGELAVYDLARRPLRKDDKLKPLAVARSIADVSEALKRFRREEIESGYVFKQEKRFGDLKYRADKQLIHDLKAVRKELIGLGLGGDNLKYAHALIGRSIFIRYLEDRGVLTKKYFKKKVARKNQAWREALKITSPELGFEMSENPPLFPRVLADRAFTYALFRRLARDFNGDMFPDVDNEEKAVGQRHLDKIQNMLYGEVGQQRSLFFSAYDFKVVPVELISSIYEEFYHEQSGKAREYGAFYTPPALAEFVVSQALPAKRLNKKPRVMDPACGSGIFLVESFRRIVRHRIAKQGRRLRFDELSKIVREQIAGIDVNAEAIRVTAFSLYLAMLHYIEPPDIREHIKKGNHLPNLVVDEENPNSLNVLLAANAFDMQRIESSDALKASFGAECADVVVGNPPWGTPGRTKKEEEARQQSKVAMDWCQKREYPVGDRERSQAFIWRALDLLKCQGTAGLLVSTGVFFKHHEKSVRFRKKWLESCALDSVFNFSHCRHVFFRGVTSPFALALFHHGRQKQDEGSIHYWSAKRTRAVEGLESIVFDRSDLKQLTANANLSNHWPWKTQWWGGHRDANLIRHLKTFKPFETITAPGMFARGYQISNRRLEAGWLGEYQSLPVKHFHRYGTLNLPKVLEEAPSLVEARGVSEVYDGLRLLVQRGIGQRTIPKGRIDARLEDRRFCFTNAIIGVKLPGHDLEDHKVVLGLLWSSLARYYYFMTTATWGIWHHEIELYEVLSLPVTLENNTRLKKRIAAIVDELRCYDPPAGRDLLGSPYGASANASDGKQKQYETELDRAIFELYGLGEAEIDLVLDMCKVGIDFCYNRDKSKAVKPFEPKDILLRIGKCDTVPSGELGDYIRVFMESWAAYLEEGTELHWEVHPSANTSSMLAAVFTVRDVGDVPAETGERESAWENVLQRLSDTMRAKMSSRIYVEGLARAVSDDEIIIIKRNERRLWTKSMAREDAEATLVQAMNRDAALEERRP